MQTDIIGSSVNAFLDFILPRICPSCQKKLSLKEQVICKTCLESIEKVTEENLCDEFIQKFLNGGIISGITSLFIFEKDSAVQDLIHSAKYEKRFKNAYFLGRMLGTKDQAKLTQWRIDLIIPVPLHRTKEAERGYNQSYFIAKGISRVTGIPVGQKTVKRIRYTQSQTLLTFNERQTNVKDAFRVRAEKMIKGRNILVVDDVITSGSTISECARVLKNSGAGGIYAASAALV